MTDEKMLTFARVFSAAVVFAVSAMIVLSVSLKSESTQGVGVALFPSLAVMVSTTFLVAVVRKQSNRILQLEQQIGGLKQDGIESR